MVPPKSVPDLLRDLKNPDWRTRFVTVERLAEKGWYTREVIPALIQSLKDENWRVRGIAAKKLGEMGPAARAAVPALLQSVETEDPRFREPSKAITKIGAAGIPLLVAALDDLSFNVRRAARNALQQIGTSEALQAVKNHQKICGAVFEIQRDQTGGAVNYPSHLTLDSPKYLAIQLVRMDSIEGKKNIEMLLDTDTFPTAGPIRVRYRFLFDSDNNPKTGRVIEKHSGIEKEIRIEVEGKTANQLTVSGFIIDHITGGKVLLPTPPKFTPIRLIEDYATSEKEPGPGPIVGEEYRLTSARDLLAFTADQIPVTVISQDANGLVADTASFVFDQRYWKKIPTLTLSAAAPGEMVRFTVKGLTPGKRFNLKIALKPGDDLEVLKDQIVGHDSLFSGSFRLPLLSPGDHTVIAQDETSKFAFTVTTCDP